MLVELIKLYKLCGIKMSKQITLKTKSYIND